ncbi:MAG TPA: hypothetical protein VHB97_08080 [Polyangia bacterium]|jgi:hypothetical protein|nr:hypothetical protein [Polyangia bacterium]
MRSSWSLGPLFIVVGGIAVSPLGTRTGPLTPVAIVIAAVLIAAGVLFLTKRPFAFWVGIVAAGLTALTGLVALAGHPRFALPLPPALSVGLGLYLGFRAVMARVAANTPRRFIPTDEDYDRKQRDES